MTHLLLGFTNIFLQYYHGTWELSSKIVIMGVILICLLKTFFFMRIVKKFSYIVTMINLVFRDLLVFLLFYAIQILMFSLLFDVISKPVNVKDEDDLSVSEYRHIPPFMGNLLTTMRLSLGDFAFELLQEPDDKIDGVDDKGDNILSRNFDALTPQ